MATRLDEVRQVLTVPGGPYNFELAVTMPALDALTAASDIKTAYNTLQNNDGKNLGLTSMGITIQKTANAGTEHVTV